jgi:hypothetical protein
MFWELRMRSSPSLIPASIEDRDIYLVLDDFGRLGRSWREADEKNTDRVTVFRALLEGQYNAPVRVIAFNIAEGWSRDVSQEIADELAQLCAADDGDIPAELEDFIERHGSGRPARSFRYP